MTDYQSAARRANTRRAFESDMAHFREFCASQDVDALAATSENINLYVQGMADEGLKLSTIRRRLASISTAFGAARLDSPTKSFMVRETLAGIREVHYDRNRTTRKRPLLIERLRSVVSLLDDAKLIDVRDRALLLVQFAGALRRSEIVALDVDDVEFLERGMKILIRRSKTDKSGDGVYVAIPKGMNEATCPVRSLESWLKVAAVVSGAVFRGIYGIRLSDRLSGQSVALIVKRRVVAAGFDPKEFSGHSARAGFCSSAIASGQEARKVMKQSRHKDVKTFEIYVREVDIWDDNAAGKLGL